MASGTPRGLLIAGIGWIGDLIEIAGGVDVFPEFRDAANAAARVTTPVMVRPRESEVIVAPGPSLVRGNHHIHAAIPEATV